MSGWGKERLERSLLDLRVLFENVDEGQLLGIGEGLVRGRRIFVAGVGRSGSELRGFAARLSNKKITVYVVHDAATPNIESDDYLLVASGSGDTTSVLAVLEKATEAGCRTGVITANALSPLGRAAGDLLVLAPFLPVGDIEDDQAMAVMQTLFTQALHMGLDVLASRIEDAHRP